MNAPAAALVRASLAALALVTAACGGDDEHTPDAPAADDAAVSIDAAAPDDAAPGDGAAADAALVDATLVDASLVDAGPPMLTCTPDDETVEGLCTCMANIVCDQIYACLSAEEIASRPGWSPRAACVSALEGDCLEDLPGTENLPEDFPACVTDLGAATCPDFGDFASVSGDFPASCDNLRALDTALGIDP